MNKYCWWLSSRLLAAIIFPDGNFVTSWGVKGTGEGDFLHPHGIAVDPQGFVYVTDEEKHDVQKFDSNGSFILSCGAPKDENLFSKKIEDVNVDKDGNVFRIWAK